MPDSAPGDYLNEEEELDYQGQKGSDNAIEDMDEQDTQAPVVDVSPIASS